MLCTINWLIVVHHHMFKCHVLWNGRCHLESLVYNLFFQLNVLFTLCCMTLYQIFFLLECSKYLRTSIHWYVLFCNRNGVKKKCRWNACISLFGAAVQSEFFKFTSRLLLNLSMACSIAKVIVPLNTSVISFFGP